jgi:hypothetical protein
MNANMEIKWLGHTAVLVDNMAQNRWDLVIDGQPVEISRYQASFIWDAASVAIEQIQNMSEGR